jgi:type II secretory pathway component PulK
MSLHLRRSPVVSRRGTVLVMAIWVILILAAMALVFTRSMRVEVIAAGNRLSANQADAVERGAEQYVLARVDKAKGDAIDVTSAPAEAIVVGDGYFWIIRPTPDDKNTFEFGIADEASKLNLNSAAAEELQKIPGMTESFVAAIMDWRDTDTEETEGGGAESDYYESIQPEPYKCKNGPIESIEELMLIKGATDNLVYGHDRNQNGAIDDVQVATVDGVATPSLSMNADERGLAPFLTVATVEKNVDIEGKARVSLGGNANPGGAAPAPGTPPAPGGENGGGGQPRTARQEAAPTPGGQPNPAQPGQPQGGQDQNDQAVRTLLQEKLTPDRVGEILTKANAAKPYTSVLDFAAKGGMKADELKEVMDRLSIDDSKAIIGRVNVNTASRDVLASISGLSEDEAGTLISQRPKDKGTDASWVVEALTPEQLATAGAKLTGQSYQYSADIIAINGTGRAFKRTRIVVDARQSPPVIVSRKDLTSLGWPLPEDIRTRLKSGERLQTEFRDVPAQGSTGS